MMQFEYAVCEYSSVSFFHVVDSLLCPNSVILSSLVDGEFCLLVDDILFILSVVISSFVDLWLLFCVLLFLWLSLIVSLSMEITSLCELIGIWLLLIDWYPGVAVVGLYQTLHRNYGSLKQTRMQNYWTNLKWK